MSEISEERPMGMMGGVQVEMTNPWLSDLHRDHKFLSDGDSATICSLVEEVQRLRALIEDSRIGARWRKNDPGP